MLLGPTQPLMPPRLLPIRKRLRSIALIRCRYTFPFTRTSTISPTRRSAGLHGASVTRSPSFTLPCIEWPRGLICVVCPLLKASIANVAQFITLSLLAFKYQPHAQRDQHRARYAAEERSHASACPALPCPANQIAIEVQPGQQDSFIGQHHQAQPNGRIARIDELGQDGSK